jgi:acetoin utilization protein AcuB
MLLRDWMTEDVEVVAPQDDVGSVMARLRDRRVGQFPVVSEGKLIGIITDRDLHSERDPHATVATLMTPAPLTATPTMPVEHAAALLRDRKLAALPVMDGEEIIGIVSKSDLLAAIMNSCDAHGPVTLIDLLCEEGDAPLERIRRVLERRGGCIEWISGESDGDGMQYVKLRLRMPTGQVPELMLEEAGFRVLSCVMGDAGAF